MSIVSAPEQEANPFPQFRVNLRRYRKAAGLTQEALARQIDVTLGSVKDWERGMRVPRTRQLAALSLALGVHVTAFFADVEAQDEVAA